MATSATTSRPPSSARTRFTLALRLRLINKKTPNAATAVECWKDDIVITQHPTVRSASEVSLLHCSNNHTEVRESPSKRAHLLGSLSPLVFKVARFRAIKSTYLTHCRLGHGNPRRWGCRRHVSGNRCRVQWWLGHLWAHLQHLEGTSTLGPSKKMDEHKKGPVLNNVIMLIFNERWSISTNLMSTLLAFSMSLHSPFVRLTAEQTKVVTLIAPLNRYVFEMFF